ncbi:MAG: hypothetical protein GF344_14075 [Chitinivibrionales bacterium]|nr:hypothetical protein [Chitinivibrionales bacterium]MBD3357853.1 hypothetical protein [Chitinivibrionales bacterium]
MWHSDAKDTIGTLRVRGAASDDPALRISVSKAVERMRLHPERLAPSAILIVRYVQGILAEKKAGTGGRQAQASGWGRVVRKRLDDLSRCAERPQNGVLPVSCDAVLFTNPAELLACLALDLVKGAVGDRWWWKSFVRNGAIDVDPGQNLYRMLYDNVSLLPAIFQYLYTWGRAGDVAGHVEPENARELSVNLANMFGMTVLSTALETQLSSARDRSWNCAADSTKLETRPRGEHSRPSARRTAGTMSGFDKEHAITSDASTARIWSRLLPPNLYAPQESGGEQTYLSALAIALRHSPRYCGEVAVQRALASRWGTKIPFAQEESSIVQYDTPEGDLVYKKECDAASLNPKQASPVEPLPVNNKASPYQKAEKGRPETKRISADLQKKTPLVADSKGFVTKTGDESSTDASETKKHGADREKSEDVWEDHTVSNSAIARVDLEREGVITDLGGVLYLINLMQRLDLPACFESDRKLQSRLSPWALLELLARGLLRARGQYDEDPLWKTLLWLDGRAVGEPVGESVVDSRSYRMPDGWLRNIDLEKQSLAYAEEADRLRVWSCEGFMIADFPLRKEPTPRRQAQSFLGKRSETASVPIRHAAFSDAPLFDAGRVVRGFASEGLERWLGYVLPFVDYMLATWTGSRDDSFDASLLHCRGRLFVTGTHVDFRGTLDGIALPIRRAGLDQNPGWMPMFGRVVLFHFD